MSGFKKASAAAMALAAAGLVGCAGSATKDDMASATSDSVHCYGVNKCKGFNDCKTAHNACKGMGSCKGLGFVTMSAKACADVGGKAG